MDLSLLIDHQAGLVVARRTYKDRYKSLLLDELFESFEEKSTWKGKPMDEDFEDDLTSNRLQFLVKKGLMSW